MLTILGVIAVIGVVMFVHELGHFVMAKRAGIIVQEFGFGFPPRLIRLWQDRATIYIGGEKLLVDKDVEIPQELVSRCNVHYQTKVDDKGRTVVTQIEVVDPEETAGAAYVEKFDPGTEYTLNAIPFLAFVRMLGEEDPTMPGSFAAAPKRARFAALFGGPAMNLLLALILFIAAYMVGWPEPAGYNVLIVDIAPNSPADTAGLQVNDLILSIDGHHITTTQDLITMIDERLDQSVILEIERQQDTLSVDLVPRSARPETEGAMGVGIADIVTSIKPVRYPLGKAIVQGTKESLGTVAMIVVVPVQIIRGLIPIEQARPTGIVGIARMTADAVNQSVDTGWLFPVIQLMAVISIAIGITNLLPIPAFDGGRLLFVFLEAIRGKRISPEREGAIHFIGLTAMLALMLVITYFDITMDIPTIDWGSLLPQ